MVFNYKLFDNEIEPNIEDLIRVYALLGKKFYLHHICYIVNANDININEHGTYVGSVKEVIDYGKDNFIKIILQNSENEITARVKDKTYKIGESVRFDIPNNKIGILDLDFNVRLI